MIPPRPVLACLLTLCWALPAAAASSDWAEVEGGAVRLVVSAQPDQQGRLRGALEVELKPGWKTYWREPGGSGVPPFVAVTADGHPVAVEMDFPAPQRHGDGSDIWAGYDRSVAFALTLAPPAGTGTLDASVFLGVCRDICIPVQASFRVETAGAESLAAEEQVVSDAFAALPAEPRAGLRVASARVDGDSLMVEAEAPASAELFLASDAGPIFGTPQSRADGARVAFRVPLLGPLAAGAQLAYTLAAGDEAVAGTVDVAQ
jgi:DsbC/DsbD-like thiol-disulfide interchange protein